MRSCTPRVQSFNAWCISIWREIRERERGVIMFLWDISSGLLETGSGNAAWGGSGDYSWSFECGAFGTSIHRIGGDRNVGKASECKGGGDGGEAENLHQWHKRYKWYKGASWDNSWARPRNSETVRSGTRWTRWTRWRWHWGARPSCTLWQRDTGFPKSTRSSGKASHRRKISRWIFLMKLISLWNGENEIKRPKPAKTLPHVTLELKLLISRSSIFWKTTSAGHGVILPPTSWKCGKWSLKTLHFQSHLGTLDDSGAGIMIARDQSFPIFHKIQGLRFVSILEVQIDIQYLAERRLACHDPMRNNLSISEAGAMPRHVSACPSSCWAIRGPFKKCQDPARAFLRGQCSRFEMMKEGSTDQYLKDFLQSQVETLTLKLKIYVLLVPWTGKLALTIDSDNAESFDVGM